MKNFTLAALALAGALGMSAGTTPVTIPTTASNPFVISEETASFEVNSTFTATEAQPGGELENATTALLYWPGEDAAYGEVTDSEITDGTKGSNNLVKYADGCSILLERNDKTYSSANKLTIDGTEYTTIKLSNGATNVLYAPEGKVINKLVLYSYVNYNRVDKGSEGRVSYWKQIGDFTYTEADATIFKDYMDSENYGANPDKVEVSLPNLSQVTFINTGEQVCFILEVTYGTANSGIQNVTATPALEDGVRYNLQGIRVDENYKGIVIMNGKKYLNR